VVDPERVRTNLVMLDLTKFRLDAREFVAAAAGYGLLITAMAPRLVRLSVHLDVDDDAIDRAIEVVTGILSA